jgi:hypothetical protein
MGSGLFYWRVGGGAMAPSGARILRKFADQCWSTDFHLGLTGVPLAVNSY